MSSHGRIWAAILVGGVAFALYRATLLPGFDFGDTGFLQATVGELDLTPRNG
jgi:predicted cupin superfamily sugar epimerase